MKQRHITEHAQRRLQQRGISDLQIQLITVFGEDRYQKGGDMLSYIPERMLANLRQAIDRLSNVAIVKSGQGKVITTMHMDRKIYTTDLVA